MVVGCSDGWVPDWSIVKLQPVVVVPSQVRLNRIRWRGWAWDYPWELTRVMIPVFICFCSFLVLPHGQLDSWKCHRNISRALFSSLHGKLLNNSHNKWLDKHLSIWLNYCPCLPTQHRRRKAFPPPVGMQWLDWPIWLLGFSLLLTLL